MSFNCGLSNAKIGIGIVNEKWKVSVSVETFAIVSKGVPVKNILASVEDRLRSISPSEADFIRGKLVSNIRDKKQSKSVLALQQLKTYPSIIITKADKGNITTVLDKTLWPQH